MSGTRERSPHSRFWPAAAVPHADDAIQYLLAGANAVQIGTANYGDPIVMARVAAGIQDHLTRAGLPDIAALSGRANPLRGAQPRGSRTGVGTERTVMTRRSPFVANSARLEGLLRAFDLSGRTPFGLDRLALSPGEEEAHATFARIAQQHGLEITRDPLGNSRARLGGRHTDRAPVMTGSRLDGHDGGSYRGRRRGDLRARGAVVARRRPCAPPCPARSMSSPSCAKN